MTIADSLPEEGEAPGLIGLSGKEMTDAVYQFKAP